MKVLGLVGHSNSGKTTLVERLLPECSKYGRVGTVKSIHHDIEVDTPGTDTHRHASAGAETVVGITPSTTFEITNRGKQTDGSNGNGNGNGNGNENGATTELAPLRTTLQRLQARGYDLVLVEGFRQARCPKLVVGETVPDGTAPRIIEQITEPDAVDVARLAESVCGLGD
ncbi:molybdopterin-guanine dinucleotide biosynthesis protein B [Natrialba chahannaoensis JCM 10990]|uniref:Molybdopterin-guanine dinucleotide biosynthesis protein B n=1 Tax=Natrialba chahannaoensis JCM 10990 TaxID=1227492 RepID=M0B572_9EURY|nr:molybdopterin-guanine dinucleotide biosynthesis protein MobB [Natrialba chahannaoensis]ELZ04809.1 molybdopterin-guanine dinucleotide biosynthesis protein B [Natrialba chahannaoensis JCM 10990]